MKLYLFNNKIFNNINIIKYMNHIEKLDKIISEVDEIIGYKNIENIINNRKLKIYWGTTPGRLPNILYLIPLMTLRHFIRNDCEVKILLADIHAYLDSVKSDLDVLRARTLIHEKIIKILLNLMKIDTEEIEFVQGMTYQLSQNFTLDLYKINSICTVSTVFNAGKNAITLEKDPKMTSLLYPSLQALDIEYLNCDVFFGDSKQKNICNLTNSVLDKLGYKKRGFFLNELYQNLNVFRSITFLDKYEDIEKIINCIHMKILIEFIDVIIFDFCNITDFEYYIKNFKIKKLDDIKEPYKLKEITNEDIRKSIIIFIDSINKHVREEYSHDDSINLLKEAKYFL